MTSGLPPLTEDARSLIDAAAGRALVLGHSPPCDAHALAVVLECAEADVWSLLRVLPVALLMETYGALARCAPGRELDLEAVAELSQRFAQALDAGQACERHVAMAVFTMTEAPASDHLFDLQKRVMALEQPVDDDEGRPEWIAPADGEQLGPGSPSGDEKGTHIDVGFSVDETGAGDEAEFGTGDVGRAPDPMARTSQSEDCWRPAYSGGRYRALGRDLTAEAATGLLPPFVGREPELRQVIETLCRPGKRNPVLIGPAGVGKTAIVIGLARRIVSGDVPEVLRDRRILEVRMSNVIAGGRWVGAIEEKVRTLLQAAAEQQLILFIDELHMIIGAGTTATSQTDVADMLKPGLADGSVVLIGATTDDEYRQYIESDAAFERRLQPVRVGELTRHETLDVLRCRASGSLKARLDIEDGALEWLVGFADRSMRNRYLPDKAVDLLDQCVGRACADGMETLTVEVARDVAQRTVGAPDHADGRVARLKEALTALPILAEDDRLELLQTLRVTMGGYDLRPFRPNACLLMAGPAAEFAPALAQVIADALFGSPARVIDHDLAAGIPDAELALVHLLGAPPGGYLPGGTRGAVTELTAMPWTVLLLRHVDRVDALVQMRIAEALESGYFVDGGGKRRYLSDAVVILTAPDAADQRRQIGFAAAVDSNGDRDGGAALKAVVDEELVRRSQVILETGELHDVARAWLADHLLPRLGERYSSEGVTLSWGVGFAESMAARLPRSDTWESWIDEVEDVLCSAIADVLTGGGGEGLRFTIKVEGDGSVAVEASV